MQDTYTNISYSWQRRLQDPQQRTEYVQFAARSFTKGAASLFTSGSRVFPDVRGPWLRLLHGVFGLPWWLVYLKIAIPKNPSSLLKVLWYLGSGTSAASEETGGDAQGSTAKEEEDEEEGGERVDWAGQQLGDELAHLAGDEEDDGEWESVGEGEGETPLAIKADSEYGGDLQSHLDMVDRWSQGAPLNMPVRQSPDLSLLFRGVFAEVATHDIHISWKHRLSDPVEVDELCEDVVGGLQDGAHDIFHGAAQGNRTYPSNSRLKGSLLDASTCPWWLVYFLLAEPLKKALPTIGYVGSGTSTSGAHTGGEKRARGHLAYFRNGSQTLFLYRCANGNVYKISFLVLWATPFDFRSASDEAISRKRTTVHIVESALATAMGVHSTQGSRTVVFDLPRGNFQPANVADPLYAHFAGGFVQYNVTGLGRTLSLRDLTKGLLKRSGGRMELGSAEILHFIRSVVPALATRASLLVLWKLIPGVVVRTNFAGQQIVRLKRADRVDPAVYAAVCQVFREPATTSKIDLEVKGLRLLTVEALELSLWPKLLARAIRSSIRRRHPELEHAEKDASSSDFQWGHDHWAQLFKNVDSGLLHPFHGLKDDWEKKIKVSTREAFRSKHGGSSLEALCTELVKEHSQWVLDVKDWKDWEIVGSDQGGKTRFLKWHGRPDWTPWTPPAGENVNGRTAEQLAEKAIRSSPRKELSAAGITGYIKRTFPGLRDGPLGLSLPRYKRIEKFTRPGDKTAMFRLV